MQRGLTLIILAIAIAVAYGVAFSLVYPSLAPPDASMVTLCTLLGLLTAVAITGAAKFFRGR
jgi:hypothetical protein